MSIYVHIQPDPASGALYFVHEATGRSQVKRSTGHTHTPTENSSQMKR